METWPAVCPSPEIFLLFGEQGPPCQLLSQCQDFTGDSPFDWETIWITLASFFQQCKGMFQFSSSHVSGWPEAANSFLTALGIPLLVKFSGGGLLNLQWVRAIGINENWVCTELPETLR